ncbi:MAG: hypothetical protein HUU46_19815 [Candidatus Hydrogenedentes bacterium]|nr:hypothetical protein [Candidatus Hydrogenedentota bacterium]
MTDPHDLPPLTELAPGSMELNRWLDTATRGLCDDAKARIRPEVEAHFAAAYRFQIYEGEDEVIAAALASAALGDAKRANRRYRRVYLTKAQARRVGRLAGTSLGALWIIWTATVLCGLLLVGALPLTQNGDMILAWCFTMYLCFAIQATLARRFANRPTALGRVNLFGSAVCPLALSLMLYLHWPDLDDPGWNYALLLVPLLSWWSIDAVIRLRLLAKLRNAPPEIKQ